MNHNHNNQKTTSEQTTRSDGKSLSPYFYLMKNLSVTLTSGPLRLQRSPSPSSHLINVVAKRKLREENNKQSWQVNFSRKGGEWGARRVRIVPFFEITLFNERVTTVL